MEGRLQQSDFTRYLNDTFDVLDDHMPAISLQLIRVSSELTSFRQRVFSVFFHGPSDKFLPQQTYRLRHPVLGEREIFLVPVGQDDQGFQYQAVFNYLV